MHFEILLVFVKLLDSKDIRDITETFQSLDINANGYLGTEELIQGFGKLNDQLIKGSAASSRMSMYQSVSNINRVSGASIYNLEESESSVSGDEDENPFAASLEKIELKPKALLS